MTSQEKTVKFINKAVVDLCKLDHKSNIKLLDFGCGKGRLVEAFVEQGYDAYGCDIKEHWNANPKHDAERFKMISLLPYTIPYVDNNFDVVVSTSVLEHAQNKEDIFKEIHRVLKPGGYALHLFPSKWYLPYETHIYVPLANFFWPQVLKWYLGLWALLGVKNGFQSHMSWQEVMSKNYEYCQNGLSYYTNNQYKQISEEIFGNYSSPMDFYIQYSGGGFSNFFKRFPSKKLASWLGGTFRNRFILMYKSV